MLSKSNLLIVGAVVIGIFIYNNLKKYLPAPVATYM